MSHQERNAASKYFTLLAGNVFLVGVLGGSLISISETFADDPKGIPRRLAENVPSQVRVLDYLHGYDYCFVAVLQTQKHKKEVGCKISYVHGS